MKPNFNRYFYESIRSTLIFLGLFYTLSSLWVYSSAFDSHPLYEVLYMSLLYWAVCLTWVGFKYFRAKQKFSNLFESLSEQPDKVFWALPEDSSAESKLLRQVAHSIQQAEVQHRLKLLSALEDTEDYASLVFHEMKSPLAIMEMQLHQADDKALSASLLEEVDRLSRLTEQFLYFSRANDFSKDFLLSEVSLKKLALEAVKKHRKAILAKDLKLTLDLDAHVILTDPKWFVYILEQGLSNAIKYSPRGSRLWLKSEKTPVHTQLSLIDEGRGIAPEDLKRVFDRGFTGSLARGENNATGMGLYLAQRLSQRLGHELYVTSTPELGTTFTLVLKAYAELPYKNVSLKRHFEG